MDPRVTKLADLLIHYSLKLKKGQLVKIRGEQVSLPLIKALFSSAMDVGAHPFIEVQVPECDEMFLKKGTDAQLNYISPMVKLQVDKIDAMVSIWGSENTKYLSGVDPKRQAVRQRAGRPTMMKFFKRNAEGALSWVGTQYPTMADAQLADMSLADYEDFVYGAGHILDKDPTNYWKKVRSEQLRLVKILNRTRKLQIKSDGTDLAMMVKGRKWISCHGTQNFPDGEIFTSPVEDTVEGKISFTYPGSYSGRQVHGIKLEFKKGKVIKATADKNEEFLTAMLNTDAGARRVGEIAIGTNYGIQRFTNNTLFDEKIGGTCHMALGASIPESGGKNQSGIHWDIVNDFKNGGEVYADSKLIYKNGKFRI